MLSAKYTLLLALCGSATLACLSAHSCADFAVSLTCVKRCENMGHDGCRRRIGSRPAPRRAARPEPGIIFSPPAPHLPPVGGCYVFRVGEACSGTRLRRPPHARPFSEQAPVLPESVQLRRTPMESEYSHRSRAAIRRRRLGSRGKRKTVRCSLLRAVCEAYSPACAVWVRDACVPVCSLAC